MAAMMMAPGAQQQGQGAVATGQVGANGQPMMMYVCAVPVQNEQGEWGMQAQVPNDPNAAFGHGQQAVYMDPNNPNAQMMMVPAGGDPHSMSGMQTMQGMQGVQGMQAGAMPVRGDQASMQANQYQQGGWGTTPQQGMQQMPQQQMAAMQGWMPQGQAPMGQMGSQMPPADPSQAAGHHAWGGHQPQIQAPAPATSAPPAPGPPVAQPTPAAQVAAAASAPQAKVKKGLKNLKLEVKKDPGADKPGDDSTPASASAHATPVAAEVTPVAKPEAKPEPKPETKVEAVSGGNSPTRQQAAPAPAAPSAPAPLPEIPLKKSDLPAAASDKAKLFARHTPSAMPSDRGHANLASSIKALNLEPLARTARAPVKKLTLEPKAAVAPQPLQKPEPLPEQKPPAVVAPSPAPAVAASPPAPEVKGAKGLVNKKLGNASVPKAPTAAPTEAPVAKPVEEVAPEPQAPPQQQPVQQPVMQPPVKPMQPPQPPPQTQPVAQQQLQIPHQPAPITSPVPTPVASPSPAETGPGGKKKGLKLKNVGIDKSGALVPKPDKKSIFDDADDGAEMSFSLLPHQEKERAEARAAAPITTGPLVTLKDKGVFNREIMMYFWAGVVKDSKIPDEIAGFVASIAPPEGESPANKGRTPTSSKPGGKPEWRAALQDPKTKKREQQRPQGGGGGGAGLKPGENAYRPMKAQSRDAELTRSCKSLLNKICPDNQQVIVERLADIELHNAEELDIVIQIIFKKALDEPHYCETYANMVQQLKSKYPEFPPENEGENPLTFVRILLNTCQLEYETLPPSLDPPEEEKEKMHPQELAAFQKKTKDKALANMKFIGNLYLRSLLAAKVISGVIHDLLSSDENIPEEYKVECACQLLENVGFTLESTNQGETLMNKFCARLLDLKRAPGADGKTGTAFTKRVQFIVQDLLDLKANGWKKKFLKEQAKTKEDVRQAAVKADRAGMDALQFETAVVGARPAGAPPAADAGKHRKGGGR